MISKEELEKLFSEVKKFEYRMAYTEAYEEFYIDAFGKFDRRIKYRIVWR